MVHPETVRGKGRLPATGANPYNEKTMHNLVCAKCDGSADGFKCDACGEEFAEPQPTHRCGANHCQPKCTGCNQPQAKCTCL